MNEYPLGGQTYVSAEFRQLGVLANPTGLALHFRTEDGVVATYTLAANQVQQGVNNVPDATQTGKFYYLYTTVFTGDVSYTWYSGTVPIGQGKFHVTPPLA